MKDYNPNRPKIDIQHLDANKLYGWVMSQKLPTHGFKWLNNLTNENVLKLLEKKIKILVIYLKLVWNILKNYGNLIVIILLLQRN